MPVTYSPADEAAKIGRQLVAAHHNHLEGERIEYIFRSEAAESGGKTIWGKARKISGLNAYLAADPDETVTGVPQVDDDNGPAPFFVIELARDVWQGLTGSQRAALVDHELSHCQVKLKDGKASISCVSHDVEAFESEVARHGLWRSNLKRFAKVSLDAVDGDQMSLLEDDGE